MVGGTLSDHYDPRNNTVYLSEAVHNSTSTAAIGVATHEAGHAIQHATGYLPIKIRSAIIPVTNIGSRLAIPLILIGLLLDVFAESSIGIMLAYVGVICFSLTAVFQLITLPTEFNASARAMKALDEGGILTRDELKGARNVLSAAAMTYVAALAVSLAQLLRLVLIVGGGRRRR
jgi:Zn-dependent membrane protease YugP